MECGAYNELIVKRNSLKNNFFEEQKKLIAKKENESNLKENKEKKIDNKKKKVNAQKKYNICIGTYTVINSKSFILFLFI